MKTICRKTWLACAALALGLMSCNNNDETTAAEDNGRPTFMSLNVNFPNVDATRADGNGDANATAKESVVNKVDVFIYTASGAMQTHESLTGADFQATGSNGSGYGYKGTTKIKTTTGLKYVYVGINLPDQTVQEIVGKPMSNLTNVEHKLERNQFVSDSNGFIMFNKAVVSATFVENPADGANNPLVTVQRLVAKVTVQKAANLTVEGVAGTLDNLTFAINNNNRKFFLMQGTAPEYKDPNWADGSYDANDFQQATANDYVNVAESTETEVSKMNACYAVENTAEKTLMGEITRATVRATFIPNRVLVESANGGFEWADSQVSTPTTFYRVRSTSPAGGDIYTYDKTVAEKYTQSNGISEKNIEEFVNGYCYYDMFLNKNNWNVLRNDYYKCTITRIMAPGRSTPEVTEPALPPSNDTDISVDINVLFWNTPIAQDYELEP